jgi:heme oxygenase (biliverdin-producing, ferredoxin)
MATAPNPRGIARQDFALTTDFSSSAADGQPGAIRLGLRSRLKLDTRELQRQAQLSGIMHALLLGRIERAAYCALLRNLYEIYAGLETALETHFDHPQLCPILFRALFRLGHLENDLRYLHGSGWLNDLAVKPAALAYRERLVELADGQPGLLAAHAYVRYLGDLTDGQIVYQLVAERLGLNDAGTRFYQFGSTEDIDLLVAQFRAGLDVIPAGPAQADAIVEEAQQAFRRHVELYEQLG